MDTEKVWAIVVALVLCTLFGGMTIESIKNKEYLIECVKITQKPLECKAR